MEIHSISTQKMLQVYQSNNKVEPKGKNVQASKQSTDTVELSDEAIFLHTASMSVKNGEEIRNAKVTSLQNQIREGTYKVNSKSVVDSMIQSVILDKKI